MSPPKHSPTATSRFRARRSPGCCGRRGKASRRGPRDSSRRIRQRAAAIGAALRTEGRRRVAISWRSNQPAGREALARKKSAPLEAFRGISLRDDVALVDLQYGDTKADREAFASAGGRLLRIEGLDLFNDLDGILAAIDACDLVVTTSNVTAHLAGALGRETWLIHAGAHPAFYYWMAGPQGRSLWYPSVEIVGAPTWEAALTAVSRRLDTLETHP
jgi:hypothetical protein